MEDINSEVGVQPTYPTREELLSKIMWVADVTDPALYLEQLHGAFEDVIFSRVQEEVEKEEDDEGLKGARRLKTVADRMREEKRKEVLRRELMELQDDTSVDEDGSAGEHTAGDVDDDLNVDEEFSEESDFMDDREFLSWIHRNDALPREDQAEMVLKEDVPAAAGLELELHRVGLREETELETREALPERLQAIAERERRPRLQSRKISPSQSYKIRLGREAFWIICQLRGAGQPLAHNTSICALAMLPFSEVENHPVVKAVEYALKKMTQEFLEPAHLMLYHQTALQPLLCALLETSPLVEAAERSLPVASYAYSTRTGRRQRPLISDSYVGFSARGDERAIGFGDPAWDKDAQRSNGDAAAALDRMDFAQRKPCFIELGRLLLRILELDVLCHRLEWQRWQMLLKLGSSTEPDVGQEGAALRQMMFFSAIEADFWQSFVSQHVSGSNGRATRTIKSLGLESAFEQYTIAGTQYQENLRANAPIRVCPPPQSVSLLEWTSRVGASLNPPRCGETVLWLFNQAITEQFTRLPVLRTRLFNVFCAEGDLIVSYKNSKKADDVYPLASFFVEHSRHYLDLLERERQGTIDLFYVLNDELVRGVAKFGQLYDPSFNNAVGISQRDEWLTSRRDVMELVLIRLVEGLTPKVKAELSQFASRCAHTQCAERFGLLCAQGPYERTWLNIAAYDDEALVWEPEWNVVEALPRRPAGLPVTSSYGCKPPARVCAVYGGEGGLAHICFIDENGLLVGTMRWVSCALTSESGRTADLLQNIQLENQFDRCNPGVVVVGASSTASLGLMRSMQRFLRERAEANLRAHVPIVWAPVEVARLYSGTTYADSEMPDADSLSRTALALARYVQDPLGAISVLFDSRRTALRLSLGRVANITSEQEEQLYLRLCWEMSLWVTACGVWVDHCLTRSNSTALLQFISGFGPVRARKLQQLLFLRRPINKDECEKMITNAFGMHVAQNAVSSLRIGPPMDSDREVGTGEDGSLKSGRWTLLDQTLLPVAWYSTAACIACAALKRATSPHVITIRRTVAALLVADFMQRPADERRGCMDRDVRVQEITRTMRLEVRSTWSGLLGRREVEFVQDEMIASGQSFMRRPYRRISNRELMTYVTGITYCTNQDAPFLHRGVETMSLIVCEGEYIAGVVQSVRGKLAAASGVPSIRLTTSRGLNATISADDIDDETMKREFLEYEEALSALGEEGRAIGPPPNRPQWLCRGALIQGIVINCHWERCELRLRWCRPRGGEPDSRRMQKKSAARRKTRESRADVGDPAVSDGDGTDIGRHYLSYTASVRDATSCNSSLRTERLDIDARVFATKVSRHSLFRDVNSTKAVEFLQNKKIGEVLLRPASGHRNKAVAVVKIGEWSTCNWLISEDRRSNGSIYYRLSDQVEKREIEFNDVDEFLTNFIAPMVSLAQDIRAHRRFVGSTRDVLGALDAQQKSAASRTGTNGSNFIAYVFVEAEQQSRPSFYRVVTRVGTRERSFYLHISDRYIYIRVPLRTKDASAEGSRAGMVLLKCRNAEHVSQVVKELVHRC
ncbi:Holliday-junction resolvase-like of SPT6/SH2 domain containing protein, putative [Trypanosoma equiperdum]|uniref:Holliday-junction resolvase-like of SPT6/SH2 domain containing protein, putative n=1 Tax=Trypanosoma equiperdum TaxID=5694 RepID=A0A1G4IJC7_TRYEQ|nr:Holliday-junction resolvase-like of SPT6/SH2 domain containing protein, putative [Trypanosoma equiperdum]